MQMTETTTDRHSACNHEAFGPAWRIMKKRGAWETHTRLAFLQIKLSCTSGITSLVNWYVDWFDYKIIYGEFKEKLESGGRFG